MPINIEKDAGNLSVRKKMKENLGIYAAAGIGAFFLGVSDLVKHDTGSIVQKIATECETFV